MFLVVYWYLFVGAKINFKPGRQKATQASEINIALRNAWQARSTVRGT